MYAPRGTRIAKEYNRRKQARDAPLATLSNACTPSYSFTVNRDDFFRFIYPVALRNRWIDIPSIPTVSILNEEVPANNGQTSQTFDQGLDIFNINGYCTDRLSGAGSSTVTVTYSSGSQNSINYGENADPGIQWYFFVGPNFMAIIRDNSDCRFRTIDAPTEPIIRIDITGGALTQTVNISRLIIN